ncbi:MAG TPA: DUF5522 domain-containing protein [Daejeonella sp.]|nr:DUF5522 domain-containing protein [Daejeonella sp.]
MLKLGEDYYIDPNGNLVFTEAYHLKRGKCCKNKCRHCPWKYGREKEADKSVK